MAMLLCAEILEFERVLNASQAAALEGLRVPPRSIHFIVEWESSEIRASQM